MAAAANVPSRLHWRMKNLRVVDESLLATTAQRHVAVETRNSGKSQDNQGQLISGASCHLPPSGDGALKHAPPPQTVVFHVGPSLLGGTLSFHQPACDWPDVMHSGFIRLGEISIWEQEQRFFFFSAWSKILDRDVRNSRRTMCRSFSGLGNQMLLRGSACCPLPPYDDFFL